MGPKELSDYAKMLAATVGFDACGIAPVGPIGRAGYLRQWLDAGNAGSMDYLHRHFAKRVNPGELLPAARSVVVVALLYHQSPGDAVSASQSDRGQIAEYAWGDDYHEVMKAKLHTMADALRAHLSQPFEAKTCVDTVPLLERELAAAAGIGWIGKNTLVLNRRLGSFFFLGALVTTLEMATDAPVSDHCGTCTACLDACPTNAFTDAYEMDASRCISYLTIEHRGDISRPFQAMMGDWVFGCDVCQTVCPYNRDAPVTREPRFAVRSLGREARLSDWAEWSEADYRRNLKGSAMKRATPAMLKRNVAIAQANQRQPPPGSSEHP